jgi:hypothetical protein
VEEQEGRQEEAKEQDKDEEGEAKKEQKRGRSNWHQKSSSNRLRTSVQRKMKCPGVAADGQVRARGGLSMSRR